MPDETAAVVISLPAAPAEIHALKELHSTVLVAFFFFFNRFYLFQTMCSGTVSHPPIILLTLSQHNNWILNCSCYAEQEVLQHLTPDRLHDFDRKTKSKLFHPLFFFFSPPFLADDYLSLPQKKIQKKIVIF